MSPEQAIDAEAELVARAQAGELEAFEALVEAHEQGVYLLAYRILQNAHDAQDVTQQTFLSVIENITEFRRESSFRTWIHRIATYAALKIIRKRRGLEISSLDAPIDTVDGETIPHPEYIADWAASPEELASRNEIRELIDRALTKLDEKHRLVFLLRDVEGLTIRETAEALQISEANVKVRLLRARLQLREILTQALGDPARRVIHSHPAGERS